MLQQALAQSEDDLSDIYSVASSETSHDVDSDSEDDSDNSSDGSDDDNIFFYLRSELQYMKSYLGRLGFLAHIE